MDSSHTATLDITELSKAASTSHFFPAIENNSLLSVGQLCNEGYYVTFKLDSVTIFNTTDTAILKGIKDLGTGLWRINMRKSVPQSPIANANNVYELRNTGVLVNYLHKALFSPTKSALLHAVKKRKFDHLARSHRRGHPQAFETDAHNSYGSHESKTPKHQIHQQNSGHHI
jgi:hypothetical protein